MNKHLIIGKLKIKITTIFFIVFIIISFFYNYNKILFYRPLGIHMWRNCVSASIAQNYLYDGNFFHPRLSSLISDNDESDITVIEFPIIYYTVSILYRIFGFHELLYKLTSVLLGFLSLFYLFKLCRMLFQDNFYAFIPPILIFTSNVYTFYLNNFICY